MVKHRKTIGNPRKTGNTPKFDGSSVDHHFQDVLDDVAPS